MTMSSSGAPKRILVTGATGVVGAHAVPMLIARGHAVTAIGRTPEKRAHLQSLGARAIELDIFDEVATRAALEGIDVVLNLATHMPSSAMKMMLPWMWKENDRIRREGSAALARLRAHRPRSTRASSRPQRQRGNPVKPPSRSLDDSGLSSLKAM